MMRALQSLFFCYAAVAEAVINGSTLLRLCSSSDSSDTSDTPHRDSYADNTGAPMPTRHDTR
jgi:hypothetical protein